MDHNMSARDAFDGAKLVLLIGGALAVIRRDDTPGLAFAGCLDLPGGMRDPGETPEACVLRELKEELGLDLSASALLRPRFYPTPSRAWWFEAHLPSQRADDIVFGDEGQGWCLMPPMDFVTAPDAVPHFRERVRTIVFRRSP